MSTTTLPVLSAESGLSSYLDKINAFPYLTQEEEYALAQDWAKDQNVAAAHKLVTSHLRLVVKIASGFRGYGLPLVELISEGNIGLMQAVKKFDPEKGFRLSTYAMWWIKASIQEYVLRSWSLVKIGTTASQKKLFFNLRRIKGRLSKLDNSNLSPEDVRAIASELNVSEQDVTDMDSRLTQSDHSLNDPLYTGEDESGSEMIDMLESNETSHELVLAEDQDMVRKRALFASAMKTLNKREQSIIHARRLNDNPATLEDLSQKYGISRERVRQIEARALEKLQACVLAAATA